MLVGVWKQERRIIAGGNENGTATLKGSLMVSTKLSILLPYDLASNHALWYLSKVVENLCPHKSR